VKAKLVVMRHAQTKCNGLKRMTGRMDIPLTEIGKKEADAAGTLLNFIRFDKLYSSYLSRTFNTMVHALKFAGMQEHLLNSDGGWNIKKRRELDEMNIGKFTGRSFITDLEVVNYNWRYNVPLPGGGESEKQVVERVKKFFDSEVKPCLDRGENVLIVTHSGIMRVLGMVIGLEEIPKDAILETTKKFLPNASPFVYEFEDGKITEPPYFIKNPMVSEVICQKPYNKKPGI